MSIKNVALFGILIILLVIGVMPTVTAARIAQAPTDPAPSPTLYVLPDNFEPPSRCPGVDILPRLILHERGRVRDEENDTPLRLRSTPNTITARNILTQIPVNGVFLVLNGPVCGQTYLWYYVRYREFEGWVAEGQDDIYFVEPYLTG